MTTERHQRLDRLLVERGLAASGARARALVMAGVVFVEGHRVAKPGHPVLAEAAVEVRGPDHPWVSRGGLKLDHALTHFAVDVAGRVALDLGASTGGFVDVLLSRGAARVWAVDVGHGQLAWKLRRDARVVVLERTNARKLDSTLITQAPAVVVADLSFISLKVALPPALALAAPGAVLVALIKPQFEAGRERVGRGGIVKDPEVHEEVCDGIRNWLAESAGWTVRGLVASPVAGVRGNREFLIAAGKPA